VSESHVTRCTRYALRACVHTARVRARGVHFACAPLRRVLVCTRRRCAHSSTAVTLAHRSLLQHNHHMAWPRLGRLGWVGRHVCRTCRPLHVIGSAAAEIAISTAEIAISTAEIAISTAEIAISTAEIAAPPTDLSLYISYNENS
jgi:hypothetical protein